MVVVQEASTDCDYVAGPRLPLSSRRPCQTALTTADHATEFIYNHFHLCHGHNRVSPRAFQVKARCVFCPYAANELGHCILKTLRVAKPGAVEETEAREKLVILGNKTEDATVWRGAIISSTGILGRCERLAHILTQSTAKPSVRL